MSCRRTIPGAEAVRRITGFSTPFVGVQWEYSVPERDHVRALITFLEDRRAPPSWSSRALFPWALRMSPAI